MAYNASRVMSGTWGQVWEDSNEILEISSAQAKVSKSFDTIGICRQMMEDRKLISLSGTGSMTVNKVFSRGADDLEQALQGHDVRRTLVMALDDPDAYGAERVALYGVSYDEATLADWSYGQPGSQTIPFSFTGFKFLDTVEVR